MQNKDTPVVFIGSGEASVLERNTLIYSIRKNTAGPVDIVVFNGTHNTVERNGCAPEFAPMSLKVKYKNITEFSSYRFVIPELCGFAGRAIYLDSDMICLADINELFTSTLKGENFLAKPIAGVTGDPRWGLSVTLFDCSRCRFEMDRYVEQIEEGIFSYNDLHQMSRKFLEIHPFEIGAIDPNWNSFDHVGSETKLVHYTNLHTQPWKFRGHRHGGLWFKYFEEARKAGLIRDQDVELAVRRGHVRPDVARGNTIGVGEIVRNALSDLKATVRERGKPHRAGGGTTGPSGISQE